MSNRLLRGLVRITRPFLSDRNYIKFQFRVLMGRKLDLDNPKTMNEKLQWLKLYNRNKLLTNLVDKLEVKKIIGDKIGKEYIIPTLSIWDCPSEIEIDNLPDKFVIKTNHSGGNTGVVVCPEKSNIDLNDVKKKMNNSLKSSIYKIYGEWPYKNVNRKIFAEAYLGNNLTDYKFYCFNGYVDSVMLCLNRESGNPKFYFFDKEWNLRRYNKAGKIAPKNFSIPKPDGIEEMFKIAEKLSMGFPMVRVDLYNINGKIYFGELTFFPNSGYDPNRLPEADLYFGNLIDLSIVIDQK